MKTPSLLKEKDEERYYWSEDLSETKYAGRVPYLARKFFMWLAASTLAMPAMAAIASETTPPARYIALIGSIISLATPLIVLLTSKDYGLITSSGTITDLYALESLLWDVFAAYTAITIMLCIAMAASERLPEEGKKEELINKIILYTAAVVGSTVAVWWLSESLNITPYLIPYLEEIAESITDMFVMGLGISELGLGVMGMGKFVKDHTIWGVILTASIMMLFAGALICDANQRLINIKTYEALADIPSMNIGPENILVNNTTLAAIVLINDEDTLTKAQLDLAWPGAGYIVGNISNIPNADDVINLVIIEKHNQTHYKATIWGAEEIEYVRIGDTNGKTIPFGSTYTYGVKKTNISGSVRIVAEDEMHIEISVEAYSDPYPFDDFSDSIIAWSRDAAGCEIAIRKFYDPPSTKTTIEGLSPHTNETDRPWNTLEWPYTMAVKVDHTYYVVGERASFFVATDGEKISFSSAKTSFAFCFSVGPLYAWFSIPSKYWDFLCDASPIKIYVDDEYWGTIKFFKIWFWETPLVIALLINAAIFTIIAYRIRAGRKSK